jgi:lipoate-protein ligase B
MGTVGAFSQYPPSPAILLSLGRVPYREAWTLQQRLVAARQEGRIPDVLLLLEHPHTYTIGRSGKSSDLRVAEDYLKALGAEICAVDRGGQTTYHGPGQLVGYPILDLRQRGRNVHAYLRGLEHALIGTLADMGIAAGRIEKKTGVWVEDRKIAAIGVRFSRWVTSHGFALNVTTDLSYFAAIIPCGMPDVHMTSIAQELGRSNVALNEVAGLVAAHLAATFCLQLTAEVPSSLQEILAAVATR